MSHQSDYTIQIISTLSVAVPIAASLRHWRWHSRPVVFFVFFLVVGLLVDLLGWYMALVHNTQVNLKVRYTYNLIEPAFLIWLVGRLMTSGPISRIFTRGWIAVIPAWALSLYLSGEAFGIFKMITEVLISIGACYALLGIIEQRKSWSSTVDFWILLGVFFYNFSTFFVVGFIDSLLGFKLWNIHNLLNVVTNVIFFVGFLKSGRPSKSAKSEF